MKKIIRNIPLILTIIYAGLVSFTVSPYTYDGVYFAALKGNIISIVINRYFTWTSRVIIESVMLFVLKNLNGILWNIINALIIILLYYSLNKIFNKKKDLYIKYIISILIMLYSYNDMNTAGWSATTINYLWPLSLGIFSFIPIIHKCSNKILFLTIPALLFTCNQEQCAALVLGFSIIFLIHYYKENKRINKLTLIYLLISIIGIVFALTSPGNANRVMVESQTWFTDFNKLNILDKLLISFSNTYEVLLGRINYIIILLYIALTYYFYKNKNIKLMIPSIILLLGTIIIPKLNIYTLNTLYYSHHVEKNNVIPILNLNSTNYIITIIVSLIYLITTIILLSKIKKKELNILCPIIYIASIASRMIVGFSPTIFTSSFRTSIFMNFLIIMIIIIILKNIKLLKKEKKIIILFLLFLLLSKIIWFRVIKLL